MTINEETQGQCFVEFSGWMFALGLVVWIVGMFVA